MRRLALCLAAATALLALPAPLAAASPEQDMAVVWCHDTARDLVKKVRLRHCEGRVIGAAEAQRLHAAIEAERRARRTRSLNREIAQRRGPMDVHSVGTAFAVNARGELVTSAHVVRGCVSLRAMPEAGGPALTAVIKARDESNDLAVLRIPAATPGYLRFSRDAVGDGDPLALVGYPAAEMLRREARLTPVLASVAISDPASRGLLGVAGKVRKGHSGGPALDSRGRAVGVLKAKIDTVAARRLTGRTLVDLGVVVERGRVIDFLRRARTPHAIDGSDAPELTGRALFARARTALWRIECMTLR